MPYRNIRQQKRAEINRLKPLVLAINQFEPEVLNLTDAQLKAKTRSSASAWPRGNPWTTSCPRPLPRSGKLPGEPWASAISTCSSSEGWFSTRGRSPR